MRVECTTVKLKVQLQWLIFERQSDNNDELVKYAHSKTGIFPLAMWNNFNKISHHLPRQIFFFYVGPSKEDIFLDTF